jgi:hypothetical protein
VQGRQVALRPAQELELSSRDAWSLGGELRRLVRRRMTDSMVLASPPSTG